MEITVKTTKLQDAVGKAIKCSSNNKLIPITSLMSIQTKGSMLVLTTTDATNYFCVKLECSSNEDVEICVMAEFFNKLIQKTTTEDITLKIDGEKMEVKGNGKYIMELPLDENGNTIKFPKKFDLDGFRDTGKKINVKDVKSVLAYNKTALSQSMNMPALTYYHCGNTVVTSDRVKICSNDVHLFDTDELIPATLMDLLGDLSGNEIEYVCKGDCRLFYANNDNEIVYSTLTDPSIKFPIEAIGQILNSEFKSKCLVPRAALLHALDRIALFVSSYDKKGIYLTFTKDGITFSSKKSSGVEVVPYIEVEDFEDFTCCIDIEMLTAQIRTHSCEDLQISFGSEVAIRVVNIDSDVTQIVALTTDDRG